MRDRFVNHPVIDDPDTHCVRRQDRTRMLDVLS